MCVCIWYQQKKKKKPNARNCEAAGGFRVDIVAIREFNFKKKKQNRWKRKSSLRSCRRDFPIRFAQTDFRERPVRTTHARSVMLSVSPDRSHSRFNSNGQYY